MATLTPLCASRLQTPSGSLSDVSDCASQSSDYGYSALHDAVISHDLEYLDFLLGSGCELDQRDENGFTALHVAVLQKSLVGVERLVDAGCNLEKPTKEGMSALHIAVDLKTDNDDILSFLASTVPNINIKNKVGRTALHLSAKSGHQEYIKILLDHACDRDIKDKFGKKAVDLARTNNHDQCVEILLNYVAKKGLLSTCEGNSTTKQQHFHGERISLRSSRKKKQNIGTNGNESNNLTTCNDKEIIDSSIFQINVQNVDSPYQGDNLQLNICESLANTNLTLNCSEQEKTYVSASSSCIENNEFTKEEADTQQKKCQSFVLSSLERCAQDVTVPFTSRKCKFDEEQHDGYVLVENLEKTILDKSHRSVGCLTRRCEKERESFDNHNDIRNANCNLSSMELENQRRNHKDNLPQILPKQLSINICQSYFQPHVSSIWPCGEVGKNGHSKNDRGIYHQQLVHFDQYNADSDMLTLISAICGLEKCKYEIPSNGKRNNKECDYVKNELPASFVAPVYKLNDQIHFFVCELQNRHLRSFSTILSFRVDKASPSDALSKLLQGIKGILKGISSGHGNSSLDGFSGKNGFHGHCCCYGGSDQQGYLGFLSTSCGSSGSYGNTLVSVTKQCNVSSADLVQLFFTAAHLLSTNPDEAHATLDKFCNNLDVISCKSLILSIFTQANLLGDSSPVHHNATSVTHANSDSVLHAFEYASQQKETSYLAAIALDVILIPQNAAKPRVSFLRTNPEFLEELIRTASEETVWDENKVAAIFIQLCDMLSEDVILLNGYVDILLGTSFQKMNHWKLSSCILVCMGLLKSEFDVKISRQLYGPLLALAHVFEQSYFPSSLACLFVSFLTKPSPRFRKLDWVRENALKAAMLRELLQPNMQLGKGLKRIADVLVHGDLCETAFRCCKALFEFSFSVGSSFTSMEQGSSVLTYFGLIKSEFPVEVIQNLHHGLKLLLHAASNGYIPQSIAPIIVIFLSKGSGNIKHSCGRHVEQIIKLLTE